LHQEFSEAKQQIDWLYDALWLFAPKFLKAFLILVFFYLLYRLLEPLMEKVLLGNKRGDEGVRQLLDKSFKGLLFIVGLVTALGQFMDIAPLLGSLGLLGIAVGLAAQDTFQNFIAGITILIDKPFKVGDNVWVGDTFGTVTEITLRSTRIKTLNHEMAVLPNVQMVNQKVINHTQNPLLRLEIPFSIAYHENPTQARNLVLSLVKDDKRISKTQAPTATVVQMTDSAVEMKLRIWIKNPKDEVPIREFYNEAILQILKQNGIQIPFQQIQLHFPPAA
jgi:small conductance mechanosensitive channel